jgi:hypothetical protein
VSSRACRCRSASALCGSRTLCVRIVGAVGTCRGWGGRVQRCPVDEWRRKSAEDGYVSLGVSAILFREIAYWRRRRPSSGAVCALAIALIDFSRAADKQGGLCHIRSSVISRAAAIHCPSFVESVVKSSSPPVDPSSGATQCTTDSEMQTTCLVHASGFASCPSKY